MADRHFHTAATQGVKHVDIPFVFLPQGTGVPLMSEGDPNGSYVTVARGGSAGLFNITTSNPYVALVNFDACVMSNTPGNWSVSLNAPTKNANNTFVIPVQLYLAGVATDLAANANNRVCVWLRFRNSSVVP